MQFPRAPSGPWVASQGIAVAVPATEAAPGRWRAAGPGGCCWQPQPHGQSSILPANPPAAWATRGLAWQHLNREALWTRGNLGQEVSETFIHVLPPPTPPGPHAGQPLTDSPGWQDRQNSSKLWRACSQTPSNVRSDDALSNLLYWEVSHGRGLALRWSSRSLLAQTIPCCYNFVIVHVRERDMGLCVPCNPGNELLAPLSASAVCAHHFCECKKMQVPSQHNSKHHALGDPAGAGRDGSSVPTQTPPFCDKEGAFCIFFFMVLVWFGFFHKKRKTLVNSL